MTSAAGQAAAGGARVPGQDRRPAQSGGGGGSIGGPRRRRSSNRFRSSTNLVRWSGSSWASISRLTACSSESIRGLISRHTESNPGRRRSKMARTLSRCDRRSASLRLSISTACAGVGLPSRPQPRGPSHREPMAPTATPATNAARSSATARQRGLPITAGWACVYRRHGDADPVCHPAVSGRAGRNRTDPGCRGPIGVEPADACPQAQ